MTAKARRNEHRISSARFRAVELQYELAGSRPLNAGSNPQVQDHRLAVILHTMDWTDEGIIIGTRRHGETSLIVELMTEAA